MNKLGKIFFWLTAILVVILAGAYFAAPKLINSELLKGKIEGFLSQKVGGEAAFQNIDFSIFPRPVVIVLSGSISTDSASGIIESLRVYPRIMPIFSGKLRAAEILVKSPDIELKLKECGEGGKGGKSEDCGKPVSPESIAGVLGLAAQELPGLVVVVEDGNFNLFKKNKTVFAAEDLDVRANFPPEGLRVIKADVKSSALKLTAQQDDKDIVIQASRLQGGFYYDGDTTSLSISELIFDYPGLKLSGELSLDNNAGLITLSLDGRDVDVKSAREAVLALAGHIRVTQKIFRIVKAGNIPSITFNSKGNSFSDLRKMKNIVIKGSMSEGEIFVPGAKLDLEDASGDVVISGGILHGENLEARLENAEGSAGELRLGLKGKDAPFHLEINFDLELSELPPLLKRLVKNENFVKEITQTRNVKGKARGRMILGESLKSVRAIVEVEELNLTAEYGRIPYSLEIDGGEFSYDRSNIGVQNLSGKVGKSSFSGLAAKVELGEAPILEIEHAESIIILDEIYPWLMSYEKLRNGLKHVTSAGGRLELSDLNLKGPLLNTDDWHFTAKGILENLVFDTSLSHGPVTVKQGNLEADERMLTVTDAEINMLDALFQMSGKFKYYPEGITSDLTLGGQFGPDAAEWLSDFINLPSEVRVRPPLSVSKAHLVLEEDRKASFTGNFSFQRGAKVFLDLLRGPDEFAIKNLHIQDNESDASLEFNLGRKVFDFKFAGDLTGSTLDKIFKREIVVGSWIKGDFETHFSIDQPVRSWFEGKLEAKDVIFPWKLKETVNIKNISLDAEKNNIKVVSADMTIGESALMLKGDINAGKEGFVFDIEAVTDRLDFDKLRDTFASEKAPKDAEKFFDLPVKGIIRLKSNSFAYGEFTWEPFNADISVSGEKIDVAITEAALCGISFPGSLEINPQKVSMEFQPAADNKDLKSTTACLFDTEGHMRGSFDLRSKFTGEGEGEELIKSLNGNLQFRAGEGRIYKGGLLAKIFAFLNFTEIFRGELPDLVQDGFAYKSIEATSTIQGSTVHIDKTVIDGSSMTIVANGKVDLASTQVDLELLLAPLKTVDYFIKKTPLVRDIFKGSLISIPVKVTGEYSSPEVTYIPTSGVSSSLSNIMKNSLQTPFKIIEPVLPDTDKK
jgi:hypothetical protein